MNHPSRRTPPTQNTIASDADSALNTPTPFAERAARISCYLSLALYGLGMVSTLSPLLWGLFFVIDFAAFGLGILGIIGGVKRRATATIRMATLGVLLSGLLLVGLGIGVIVHTLGAVFR